MARAADDIAARVRQCIRGLNAQELTQREKAEKELIDLGPAALPHLPAITDRMPAEVVERLTRARQTLVQAQVREGAKASLITLKAKDMPLTEVFAELSKQSGNSVVDHREEFGQDFGEIKITADFDKTPFWQALDQVLDQAKLGVYNYGSQRAVHVVRKQTGRLPRQEKASYSGPFRVAPLRFEALADLQNPDNRSLKLFLEVAWETRLRPINIVQPLSAIQASGSQGKIGVDGGEGEPEVSVNHDATSVELQIPLDLPPRNVEKISSIKGKLNALVPGPAEEFRFSQLATANPATAKPIEQQRAAVTVTVDSARKNNDVWEISMRVKFADPGAALDSHRSWIFDNEAYLEDAKGHRIDSGGYEQTKQTKDEIGMKYLFDADSLQGQTFVYKTPLAILEIPIEYEIRDLTLP